ncbi:Tn3 family transposase [Streptomyces sp. NPDC014685]|uniref:Tn3 family transposase n=1 Tax=Streptomyces sp. NPDC014685 TaxID=3364881 RepID=UPI0036FBA61F
MRQEWSPEDVVACWTLVDGDWDLVANKAGTTRLGFCLMLKFFELEGRFPDLLEEIPQAAVEYVAGLVKVPTAEFAKYDLASRSAKNHRKQIREALTFRPATRADEDQLIMWLADEVCPVELVEDRQRDALLVECRARKIEPPGRIDRILAAAQSRAEKAFCTRTIERLGQVCTARLLALVTEGNKDGTALLASLKRDPGAVGLDSLLTEVTKLNDVRKLGLPEGLFAHCSERLVAAWRARAIKMYPSDFRDTAEDVRITLLAALCSSRQAEITDALADLLIALVQKINARAERRVEKQLTAELKKIRGKEGILFKLADAAVGKPDEIVRTALYPVVGEKTLRDLVAEAKANEKVFKAKVRTMLRSSYSSYYRQMLPPLLKTLGFKCNNTAYRPVMDALVLLEKYAEVDGKTRFYDAADEVPMDGVVRKDWREAVVDDKGKVERIPYELCVLVALRDAIRRREIYIEGGLRWRNPEDDLPGDFEATRTVHYAAIRQPMDPKAFIADLKKRMTSGLDRLSAALADGSAGGVKVTTRHGDPWITVPKLEEPTGLQALKEEVIRRWGVLDLLDVLKNADFLTGFTDEFSSVAAYERIDRAVLQRRLLLALFALGTNMGIRAIVATGEHGETEAALRHIRRHFITVDNLRAAVTKLVNATFAARDTAWWGRGTACASDSKKFGSWEAVYIIEGLLKNSSEVQPTTVHADTQGQSQPVFALAHLLGFDLMPRIRNWKGLTFYRPSKTTEYVHIDALFGEVGKNVIDWDLIESQFRHLMKVAVSVREGVISSSTLLKRLRSGSKKNATYAAFREVGRVIRTVQLLRYLCDPALRRRVTAATNKTEAFNGFSQWIGFGNRGVIADNDPVEQEKAMKFNALLTNVVIFHNALDIAEIVRQLLEEGWTIEPGDLAHISPYLTEHINRFGEYSTHELGIQPEAYDPKLDVDFTRLRDQGLTAAGLRQAA